MSEVVVGLDIGTTKIACIVGRRNKYGKIEVMSIGKADSIGVRRGVVSNIQNTIISIKNAVKQAKKNVEGELNIHSVNVGIAGKHISSKQHTSIITRGSYDNEIEQSDIDTLISDMYKMVVNPGDKIIHVLPQEFTVDGETGIENPVGMSGIRVEGLFHIIVGQIAAARNIQKCIEKSGLAMNDIILEPLASAASVLSEDEKEAGVVLVDIGGGTSDIAIFKNGVIQYTAVIPMGGDIITEDVSSGCEILKRQAEALKKNYGRAIEPSISTNEVIVIPRTRNRKNLEISLRNLCSIIKARMIDIIALISEEINNSGLGKKLPEGIVITGGGANLKDICVLFEKITGMNTRVGYPNEHLAESSIKEKITSPMFSTGIGLVLKGFEKLTEENKQEKNKTKNKEGFFEKMFIKGQKWFES